MLKEDENMEMETVITEIRKRNRKTREISIDPPSATRTETTACKKGEYRNQAFGSNNVPEINRKHESYDPRSTESQDS